ncbi:MAG: heavy-metal-associated domain-containing protein [Desulfobulbaceae bacterium]|nr:heavy-metal-associated domain-containing protein [Desulfobulbaceae bacterium]HIJ90205.1 heavy-metal-associated domain-containing protein [Deltaproteobacteria bacterium]
MGARTGSMMGYFFRSLGMIAILTPLFLGLGNASSFAERLKSTTFLVRGISCDSCLSAIGGELFKKEGMVALAADLNRGLLRIDHRPPLSEEVIVRVLSDLGYPAKLMRGRVEITGGESVAQGCSSCDQQVCSATAASWRELFRRIFGGNDR